MLGFIIAIHVLVSIFLIFIILIQPGKGYGLSETFGGQTQSIFGVRAGTLLTRITAISATIFLLASLSIAILSSKKSRSLVERIMKEETKKEAPVKEEEKKPIEEKSKEELPPPKEESPLPAQ